MLMELIRTIKWMSDSSFAAVDSTRVRASVVRLQVTLHLEVAVEQLVGEADTTL